MPKIGVRPKKRIIISEQANDDNAASTVTITGVAGKSHYVVGVIGFNENTASIQCQLKDGAGIIALWVPHQYNTAQLVFPGIKITQGNDLVLTIGASGAEGKISGCSIIYYTE